jgi:hypothetical protein
MVTARVLVVLLVVQAQLIAPVKIIVPLILIGECPGPVLVMKSFLEV